MLANKVEEEERAGAGKQEPMASLSPKGPPSAPEFGPRELSPHERGAGTLYKRRNEGI